MLTTVATCGALAAGAADASASPVVPPTGHFGNAGPVLGPGNAGLDATIIKVSCPPSGGCAEGGTMGANGVVRAFAAFEQPDRTWGTATPVLLPDPAFTSSALHEVSCGAPGNCVVAGDFDANSFNGGNFGFYAVEKNGRWIQSASVSGQGVSSQALTVSCPTAGDCAVGGKVNGQPFTVEEKGGTWGLPQPVPGLAALNEVSGFIREISCVSPGNCAAVGTYHDSTAPDRVFVVDENGGTWGLARPIDTSMLKDSGADPSTISCASPGDCAIGGTYLDAQNNRQDFVADEAGGQWKSAQRLTGVPNTGQFPGLFQVSCPAAGECVAVGRFETTDARAFIAEERDGQWQRATTPGGLGSEATSVYCPSARNCVVTGSAVFGRAAEPVAFTRYEVNGTWGKLSPLPGINALNAGGFSEGDQVACGTAGNCALGGESASQGGSAPFATISSPATTTSLKLSAGRVRFGQEQKEKISVRAAPRTGGTPGGDVTVRAGNRTLCVIKLAKGQGSCRLGTKALKPGHYQLTAAYGGSQTYRGSRSGRKTIAVSK
jgi:Bacterial Ig-like domain (group 3)